MNGGEHAIVIAAPDGIVEEEVARLFKARQRLEIRDAALDIGVAGLPVIGLDAARDQLGISGEEAG